MYLYYTNPYTNTRSLFEIRQIDFGYLILNRFLATKRMLMPMLVRKCPKCEKLFWIKEQDIEYSNDDTWRITCQHCQQVLRIPLVTEGPNAGAPKMGH